MLVDREIRCPQCGKTTIIGIASPDRSGKYERKGSFTSCRLCREKLITITEEDGTFVVLKLSDLRAGEFGGGS
jgi:hypothetical protein